MLMENRFENIDCMIGMAEYENNHFDLAVVDPEYGINISKNPFRQKHDKKEWDIKPPDKTYFDELFRVSKNQIIWGGNYFGLPASQGFLIWDKMQPEDFSSSMCEYAWMSFQSPAKMYKKWVVLEKGKIHPTQKPIVLYKWLLTKYAKQGDLILDTHVGGASSLIACEDMDFNYVGFELDEDYYNGAQKRLKQFRSQLKLAI